MARTKTYLSPADQWKKTVDYLYFLHRTRWMEWNNWLHLYELNKRWQPESKPSEELLRVLWQQERDVGPLVEDRQYLGVVRRPHRLLRVGDVFVMFENNGMYERYPAIGVSSKGMRLGMHGYWLSFDGPNRVTDLVKLPGHFINLRWDDPAIGRFVATYAQVAAAG